jgi:hypothetical protein
MLYREIIVFSSEINIFSPLRRFDPILGHDLLRGFMITLIEHTTIRGTPLDELSALPRLRLY